VQIFGKVRNTSRYAFFMPDCNRFWIRWGFKIVRFPLSGYFVYLQLSVNFRSSSH